MMARGTMNTTSSLLQGNVDTGFKLDKRTTLGTIRSVADLEDRLQALTSGQHTVMEHVESNLKVVLMGAGYTAEDAALLAHDSPFLRISVDSQSAYIGLHMHLFNVGLQHGWDHLKTELHYHVKKLKSIRALYPTRLQIIAHNYCYLRDLQAHKWQTFGIQDLRIRELQAVYSPPRPTLPSPGSGAGGGTPAGGRTHYCNHCKTSIHPGNKASCFWKNQSAADAKKAGANAVRRLGNGEAPMIPGDGDHNDMAEIP
jgi:hypothetical protein